MADLLGEDVGMTVGFTTRDERRVSPATRIEVVTEGVLTRRLQNDPSIEGTALIVFDEVHERNLQTDLGLALTLDVRGSLRPDLRILAMSATVQADRFAELLGTPGSPCPRLDASGQPYPVDIQYLPMTKSQRLEEAVANAVMRAKRTHDGDLLVFLPGAGEINRVAELLGGALRDEPIDVRPLYGMLPAAE